MKKSIFLIGLCLLLGAVLVAGCLGGDDKTNETIVAPPEPVAPPMDAAMYRGNITNILTEKNNDTIITLAQVKGTNFGAVSMKFVITSDSKTNFNISDLKNGQYVETYYGMPADGNKPESVNVIVANLLQYANMTVYNGEIISVSPEITEETTNFTGKLTVKLENNSTMIFNCNPDSTQFYMNLSNVTAGTQVNIYGSWIVQTSEPPQTAAYEIREYFEK